MKRGKYSLIYEFFKSHIEFGYLNKGDFLPTMEQLHQVYQVSYRTVRSAYLQLQAEGYVSLSAGRNTVVVYDGTPAEGLRRSQDYYLARKGAFDALQPALPPLLYPLLRAGSRRLGEKNFRAIRQVAATLEDGSFYISHFLARQMLLALHNQFVMDFYSSLVTFYQFPHFLHRRVADPTMTQRLLALAAQTVEACDRGDREGLFHIYLRLQELLDDVLQLYIGQAALSRPAPQPVPFRWDVYGDRPQMCYTVAAHLIARIFIKGEFAPGSYLPPYGAMAAAYAVSFSTIRQVVQLLGRLGIVATHQGVGAQVTAPSLDDDALQHKPVQKIITTFLEAMQIISLTLDDVAARFFQAPAWKTAGCIQRLQAQRAAGDVFSVLFTALGLLLYDSDDSPLKEIWEKFYETLLLGLPILKARTAGRAAAAQLQVYPTALICDLEQHDRPSFCTHLREMIQLVTAEMKQVQSAVQPAAAPVV